MPEASPFGNTGGGLYTGLMRGGMGFALAAAAQAPAKVAALRLALAPVEAAEEEVAEVPQPQSPALRVVADTSGSGCGSPNAAFVAGRSDSASGDRNLRTDPRSSSSGAPSAAPSTAADTRGAIGAWSPTGAPKMNGAPLAAPSEAGADVGGTADGLTIPDEEDGAERSGERSRTSYDSGSTSCTS